MTYPNRTVQSGLRVLRTALPTDVLLDTVAAILIRRRQPCYGSLQITAEQVDELARAIVQHLTVEMS